MSKVRDIYVKLEDLILFYESYIIFHENASLDILINDDSISFYLLDGEKEDNIVITFDNEEKDALNYLAILIIIKLFGKVLIHFNDGVITNDKHKKNIRITVLNEDIKSLVEKIVNIQDSEYINTDLEVVKSLESKVNKNYPKDFILTLGDRISLSKKVLK